MNNKAWRLFQLFIASLSLNDFKKLKRNILTIQKELQKL